MLIYQRRRSLVLRFAGVVSGAGHVLLGYPLRGAIFLTLTSCLLASVVMWAGVAHVLITGIGISVGTTSTSRSGRWQALSPRLFSVQ